MAHTVLHGKLLTSLWPECAATATKFENIMVNAHEEKCAHEKFYGKITDYTKYSSTLVEMGVVHSIANTKEKLKYQGNMCILISCV